MARRHPTPAVPASRLPAPSPLTYPEAQARATGTLPARDGLHPAGRPGRRRSTKLVDGPRARGARDQVLLGVTGSGKTFTIAKVIEAVNRPTLVLSHNKTLAAQLYQEFRRFFPRELGRVLRLLLRLLPARGLRPADRHVHREGDLAQRGDRQAAPGGLQGALRAARRDRRGVGVLHLRPRRSRVLLRHARLPRGRRHAGDAGAARAARRDAVRADQPGPHARQLPGARRRARDPAGLRGHRRARRVLRRRDREDHEDRSAARHAAPARRPPRALSPDVLRHAAGDARAGDRDRSASSSTSAWPS